MFGVFLIPPNTVYSLLKSAPTANKEAKPKKKKRRNLQYNQEKHTDKIKNNNMTKEIVLWDIYAQNCMTNIQNDLV